MFTTTKFDSVQTAIDFVSRQPVANKKLFAKDAGLSDYKDAEAMVKYAIDQCVIVIEPKAVIEESEGDVSVNEGESAPQNTPSTSDNPPSDNAPSVSDSTASNAVLDTATAEAKEIKASVNRTRAKVSEAIKGARESIAALIESGLADETNADHMALTLLRKKPIDEIVITELDADKEVAKRIVAGVIKANGKVVTLEVYESAKVLAVSPTEKFDAAIADWVTANAEQLKELKALLAAINGSVDTLCAAHNAEKHITVNALTGEVTIHNTLRRRQSSGSSGVARQTKPVTARSGKRVVIRGLDRKGNVNGHELTLVSDETDWYFSVDGKVIANHVLTDKVTPSAVMTQWIESLGTKTQRSIYTVFGSSPIFYGIGLNAPELPNDLAVTTAE